MTQYAHCPQCRQRENRQKQRGEHHHVAIFLPIILIFGMLGLPILNLNN
jgi:hypothetical protein